VDIAPQLRAALFDVVAATVEMLRTERYHDLARSTHGIRVSANQLRDAMSAYPYRPVALPACAAELMDVVPIAGHPAKWSVVQPLFSAEEGRSDLSLALTITQVGETFTIEVDDLHVL
jgi:hypothetical protein